MSTLQAIQACWEFFFLILFGVLVPIGLTLYLGNKFLTFMVKKG